MRYRIFFKKTEPMRYTSHLDLHRALERTFRRAGLPLVYSEGYHPQPKINLASALPLGITSEFEIADVWFDGSMVLPVIQEYTINALPPGIEIISFRQIEDTLPSLQSTLVSAIYRVSLIDEVTDLDKRVHAILQSDELIRKRREKTYDLRPLIEKISLEERETGTHQLITMQLAAREGATGRPDEVLDALSIDISSVSIHRVKLIFREN